MAGESQTTHGVLSVQITHDASSPSSFEESPITAASRRAASSEGCGAQSPPALMRISSGNTVKPTVRHWSRDGVFGGEWGDSNNSPEVIMVTRGRAMGAILLEMKCLLKEYIRITTGGRNDLRPCSPESPTSAPKIWLSQEPKPWGVVLTLAFKYCGCQ